MLDQWHHSLHIILSSYTDSSGMRSQPVILALPSVPMTVSANRVCCRTIMPHHLDYIIIRQLTSGTNGDVGKIIFRLLTFPLTLLPKIKFCSKS